MKQDSRQWFAKLTNSILEQGFEQSKSDYSLFTGVTEGIVLIVLVYVDDILVASNKLEAANSFKSYLHDQFNQTQGFGTSEVLSWT